jgi:hypothetical protein
MPRSPSSIWPGVQCERQGCGGGELYRAVADVRWRFENVWCMQLASGANVEQLARGGPGGSWAVAVGMGAAGNNKICSLIIPNCYTLALSYLKLI